MGCECPFNIALNKHPCAGPSPRAARDDAGDVVDGRRDLDFTLLAGFLPRSVGRLLIVRHFELGISIRFRRLIHAVRHGVLVVFGCYGC